MIRRSMKFLPETIISSVVVITLVSDPARGSNLRTSRSPLSFLRIHLSDTPFKDAHSKLFNISRMVIRICGRLGRLPYCVAQSYLPRKRAKLVRIIRVEVELAANNLVDRLRHVLGCRPRSFRICRRKPHVLHIEVENAANLDGLLRSICGVRNRSFCNWCESRRPVVDHAGMRRYIPGFFRDLLINFVAGRLLRGTDWRTEPNNTKQNTCN